MGYAPCPFQHAYWLACLAGLGAGAPVVLYEVQGMQRPPLLAENEYPYYSPEHLVGTRVYCLASRWCLLCCGTPSSSARTHTFAHSHRSAA